jgi:hypothetical protein
LESTIQRAATSKERSSSGEPRLERSGLHPASRDWKGAVFIWRATSVSERARRPSDRKILVRARSLTVAARKIWAGQMGTDTEAVVVPGVCPHFPLSSLPQKRGQTPTTATTSVSVPVSLSPFLPFLLGGKEDSYTKIGVGVGSWGWRLAYNDNVGLEWNAQTASRE